ncbi:hypothetical protein [Methylocystis sp. S23]
MMDMFTKDMSPEAKERRAFGQYSPEELAAVERLRAAADELERVLDSLGDSDLLQRARRNLYALRMGAKTHILYPW